MNIRIGLAIFALGTLASVPAFAQTAPCNPGTQPAVGQAVYGQQTVYTQPAVYAQPTVYAQPVAHTQPVVYAQPGGYGTQRGARYAMAAFVNNLRARMNQSDMRLRAEVASGRVSPQAIEVFSAERNQIEGALARASGDGVLAPFEHERLGRMADRMDQLGRQYRVAAVNRAPGWGRTGRARVWR